MEIRTIGIDLGKTVFHFEPSTHVGKSWFARRVHELSFCALPRTSLSA